MRLCGEEESLRFPVAPLRIVSRAGVLILPERNDGEDAIGIIAEDVMG